MNTYDDPPSCTCEIKYKTHRFDCPYIYATSFPHEPLRGSGYWEGEDATAKQRSYLQKLAQKSGVEIPNLGSLTKKEAGKKITALKKRLENQSPT